jgi:hypothetical protein
LSEAKWPAGLFPLFFFKIFQSHAPCYKVEPIDKKEIPVDGREKHTVLGLLFHLGKVECKKSPEGKRTAKSSIR